MGVAEGTFDFDLELKKRLSLATILDKIAKFSIGSPVYVLGFLHSSPIPNILGARRGYDLACKRV